MAENLEFNTDIKVNADTSEAKSSVDSFSESLNKASENASKLGEKLISLNNNNNDSNKAYKEEIKYVEASNSAKESAIKQEEALAKVRKLSNNLLKSTKLEVINEKNKELLSTITQQRKHEEALAKVRKTSMVNLLHYQDSLIDSIFKEVDAQEAAEKAAKQKNEKYRNEVQKSVDSLLSKSGKVKDSVGKPLTAAGKMFVDYFEKAINKVVDLSKEVWNLGLSFEETSQKVRTLVDETAVSFDSLQKQLLGISSTYGESIDSVNESAYQALSASVKTEDLLTILDVAQKASIAGFTDSTTAIDGLTSVINAYGMSVEDADDLANKFLITQNLGKTTFGEIASSIGQIAPNAKIVGLSIDDVLAAIATLTAQGVSTDEAITQLNGAINSIIDPSKEASEAAAKLGVEFNEEALRSKGLIQFLSDIKNAAGDDNDALTDMFGNIRGFKALAGLTEGEDKFNEALYQMQNNTTALDDAFAKMTDTVSFSTDRLKESIKGIGVLTFDSIKEPVKDFVDYMNTEATSVFDEISENGLDPKLEESINSLLEALKDAFDVVVVEYGPEILDFLSNIINLASTIIKSISIIAENPAIKFIVSVFNNLLEIFSKLDPIIVASVATMALYIKAYIGLSAVIPTVVTLIKSVITILSVYKTAVLTATISTNVFIGVITAGLALLVSFVGYCISEIIKAEEEAGKMRTIEERVDSITSSVNESKKAFDELKQSAEDTFNSIVDNLNDQKRLWDELNTYVNEDGVLTGNVDRAKAIIEILNGSYDMNIKLNGNVIAGYDSLHRKMDTYFSDKEKEAELEKRRSLYTGAASELENQKKAYEDFNKSAEAFYEKLKQIRDEYNNESDLERRLQLRDELDETFAEGMAYIEARDEAEANIKELEATMEENLTAIEDIVKDTTDEVTDYITFKTEDALKTVEEYIDDFKNLQESALDNYKDGLDAELNEYEKMLDKKAEAVEEFYDNQLEQQEAAHKKIISDIEAEYALETGKIDEDEYNRELSKLISERDKIQKKIDQYGSMESLKTSADRKELASLQKELESQNEKIAEKQHDREVSLKKAKLKEKADLAKDAENSRWEQEKESINKSKTEAVNAQKEANAAELDDFKKIQSAKEKAFKEAQEQMLEEVKTFSADSLAVLTSDWGTYVDSMTGTFKGALADLSTAQKDIFLSSSEAMQQAITDVRESLSESVDDLSEYMDKIDTIKELQSLPPERIAAKASALDLTVEEALQLKDVDLKMLTEGMTYTIKSAGTVDNSVTNTNSNNITYNYYYNGEKTKQTTYAGAVR